MLILTKDAVLYYGNVLLNIEAKEIVANNNVFAVRTDNDVRIYDMSAALLRNIPIEKATSISINSNNDMLIAANHVYKYNYFDNTYSIIDDVYKTCTVNYTNDEIYLDVENKPIGEFQFLHDVQIQKINSQNNVNTYTIDKDLSLLNVYVNGKKAQFQYDYNTGELSINNYHFLGTEDISYTTTPDDFRTYKEANSPYLKDPNTGGFINIDGTDYKNHFNEDDYEVPNKSLTVKGFV